MQCENDFYERRKAEEVYILLFSKYPIARKTMK